MAVYNKIIDKIRDDIHRGVLKSGDKVGTEVGLSRKLGISRSSIRTGINILIKEKLIERKAGQGFFVAMTTTPSMRNLAIIVPSLDTLWTSVVNGARAKALENGYKLQIYNVDSDVNVDLRTIRELPETAISGALIVSVHNVKISDAIIDLYRQDFPLVMLDQRFQDIEIPSVTFDDYAAGYLAGSKLIDAGHRRIGFVGYAHRERPCLRLEGLRDAINDAGIPFDRSLMRNIPFEELLCSDEQQFEDKVIDLINMEQPPTAIFFHTDILAAKAYVIMRRLNMDIPSDINIVGCGNSDVCQLLNPSLATVELSGDKMGKEAIALLLKKIRKPESFKIENKVVKVHWQAGDSLAPL